MGLRWDVWVLRELLPTTPIFYAFSGRMPIVREFRVFAAYGVCKCLHPYWPPHSIEDQRPSDPDWRERLDEANTLTETEKSEIESLAARASAVCGGAWSVDVLWTEQGLYVTDMAEAYRSFHWEGCPVAEEFSQGPS